ncbi:hypothetical protein C1645_744365 [Glomus cerebriforme]|uniref:TLDc domain-containing protein n=1 Tax=Glomus cerebriforme TaxID=658196 RepID=A0A397S5J8_9GLOM|nr:hypothetical protein C1645_744365 [Glomus cerebriforme]
MSEIQIWEHILKWGLAQNPELPADPTNFSKENFRTKYHLIKKILPGELYKDLLKYFLKQNNQKSEPYITKDIKVIYYFGSKIFTSQHAELIFKWVNISITGITSMFKLLIRGSRDGFTHERFHEIKMMNLSKENF